MPDLSSDDPLHAARGIVWALLLMVAGIASVWAAWQVVRWVVGL